GCDIYEVLHLCDILITDYSSIFFDFLKFNKPIIFYPYDFLEYQKLDRCFYFDYKQFVPGPIVYSFDEMLKLISRILSNGLDGYQGKRKKLEEISFQCKSLLLNNILIDY